MEKRPDGKGLWEKKMGQGKIMEIGFNILEKKKGIRVNSWRKFQL